jgi:cell wall-associated NlpC family hydrolase
LALSNYEPPKWVNQYIGIEFNEFGRTPDEGFDCWGLCRWIWKEHYGIDVPRYDEDYEQIANYSEVGNAVKDGIADQWQQVDDIQEGDGVVLRLNNYPMHIGVIVAKNTFLHVYRKIQTSIARLDSLQWDRRIVGFYRHQSVINDD